MSTENTASWLLVPGGPFTVKEASYSRPESGEVVIKNYAVAINPMDWKIQLFGGKQFPVPKEFPAIIGADVAGEVYEVGEGVDTFKKGDRVMGVNGSLPIQSPGSSTSSAHQYQTASEGPLGRGGSSSTGSATIQLAVASGLTVVATASSKNHGFVKALGATHVLDYRDENIKENLVATIKETKLELAGAVDAIGEEPTCRMCAEVTKALGGGKVATFMPQGIENPPEGVAVLGVTDTANIINNEKIVKGIWTHYIPEALRLGTLKAVPEPIIVGRGLGKVEDGVAMLKSGISAGKLVVEL